MDGTRVAMTASASSNRTESPVAAVVIGRNEGERLESSIQSVEEAGLRCVYADSGSTDGSLDLAQQLGAHVLMLDADRPFSAARGRNEGLAEMLRLSPSTQFVMFLDGDSILSPTFVSAALQTFMQKPGCAIVTGHLLERYPDASIYNRLCSIEWRSPAGPIIDGRGLGGIMAVRVAAFRAVGGFNEQAIAGEEADLAGRLARAGWTAVKIDEPMATHDAQMMRMGQWWRRTLRSGHAMAHRYLGEEGPRPPHAARTVKSAVFWGLLLPLAIVLLLMPTRGASLLFLLGYCWLAFRIYRRSRLSGLDASDAWLRTRYTILAKVPECLGILRYTVNRFRHRFDVIDWR
jgi:GT2 family glycosyltransferase